MMTDMMGWMMGGSALVWFLLLVAIGLAVAALIKYLKK